MRASVCTEHGAPDVVRVLDVPAPAPGPGQARVRVHAAAVNFPDVLLVADRYQLSVPAPFVPGSEFAGVVDEVATDVEDLGIGDRVTGTTLVGAFAEAVVTDTGSLRPIPEGVGFAAAAATGVAHSTAMHVLRSVARIQPGEELVVLGAGGGVGLAAVQLGHRFGASVTAVASSAEKLEVAEANGATHLIDHRRVDLREALRAALPDGAHAVIDPVGGTLSEPALRSLRWGGRFVTVGFASGEIPRIPLNLVLLKGVAVLGFQFRDFVEHAGEDYGRNEAELSDLLRTGRISAHIGATFALEEVAEALAHVADGKAIGKVIIDVRP
ncbi:MAG: NADPH:quinone oxidoreductase family protein [Acidimicrobiia bacterium]|nr:NADPH:quinone oxidoreductase family protein [Acidimicrobiia bacterium]